MLKKRHRIRQKQRKTDRTPLRRRINLTAQTYDTEEVRIYYLFGVDFLHLLVVYSLHYLIPGITHCNPWFMRWRAWLNSEINVGGWCCPHLFGPWCSPAKQGLFADAHRVTRKVWWWVVLVVVKRRTQQPTHPLISTHRPVPTRPPCKVALQWQRSQE